MPAPQGNLRAPEQSFFGRGELLRALRQRLDVGARLLTLTGPGGQGKSRTALELCWHLRDSPAGGVWRCELSEARSRADVCTAVALALSLPLKAGPGDPDGATQLGRALAAEDETWLLLDGAERAAEALGPLLSEWMAQAPAMRAWVTSRRPLQLAAEEAFALPALDPEDAAALFVARSQRVRPGFALDAESRPVVDALVATLDANPLAIELAAARSGVLAPAQLLARLTERFGVLSLQATVDWSWALLSEAERRALACCATFRGGFSLEAAEAVIATDDTLDLLESLLAHSLLRSSPAPLFPGELRFELSDTLLDYTSARLNERADCQAVRARHAQFFLQRTESWSRAPDRETDALRRLQQESDNALAALAQTPDAEVAARLAVALDRELIAHGPLQRRISALGIAAQHLDSLEGEWRGALLNRRGELRLLQGDIAGAEADLEAARDIAETCDALALGAAATRTLGRAAFMRGDPASGRRHSEASLVLARRAGDRLGEAWVLGNLAWVAAEAGELDAARDTFEQVLSIAREIDNPWLEGLVQNNLGYMALEGDALESAMRHLLDARALLQRCGDRLFEAQALEFMGSVQLKAGNVREARRLLDAGYATARALGFPAPAGDRLPALRATAEAMAGELDAAQRDFREARELASPGGLAAVTLLEGFLDLAQARAAQERHDELTQRACHERAQQRLSDGDDAQSGLLRLARTLLSRALEAESAAAPSDAGDIAIAEDASALRIAGEATIAVTGRRHRLILARLLEARRSTPGEALSVYALVDAGWPGEDLHPEKGARRVYVAISKLRGLGLGEAIVSSGGGYYLAPARVKLEKLDL